MKILISFFFAAFVAFGTAYTQSTATGIESKACLAIQAEIIQTETELRNEQKALQTASPQEKPSHNREIAKLRAELANLKTSLATCVSKLPDLIVTDFRAVRSLDNERTFSVTVKNIGGANAQNCSLMLSIFKKEGNKKIPFYSLPIGESRTINNIIWDFKGINIDPGDFELLITVDSDNTVIESNGKNNTKGIWIIG